jgi:hypothetical protein
MDNSKTLREYVALYGSYTLAQDAPHQFTCDRCKENPWPEEKLLLWMTPKHFIPGPMGNGPYLCPDCARHFGLAW